MLRFVIQRFALSLLVVVVASVLIFGSLHLVPGNPIATLAAGRPVDARTRALLTAEYHLDDPFVVQYVDWIKNAVAGNFGRSYVEGESVRTLVSASVGTTFLLVAMSSVLIIVGGVATGTVAALRRGWIRSALTAAVAVGLGVPTFVAAMVLITLFAVNLGWFPVFGSGTGLLDDLWHLTLPAIALAFSSLAYIARITQASVEAELQREHVMTATARGLPRRQIIRRHVLRNAAIPVTTASGLIIAYLVVGASVVEQSFSLNGLGALLVNSIAREDFPVVQAISLIVIVSFVVVNLVVDLLASVLDPRVGLQ